MDGKHPYIDADVMEIVGGRKQLLDQANILENETNAGKMGKFKPDWKDVKTSIKKIDYDVAIIPELCEREQIEDPRERQLRLIARVEKWRRKGQDCAWLCSYYDDLLDLLNRGKEQKELEDETFFCMYRCSCTSKRNTSGNECSVRVSFTIPNVSQKNYEDRILSVLKAKSPFYIEEMSDDELLDAHNIHSYAQTLEWKGTLQYIINDEK